MSDANVPYDPEKGPDHSPTNEKPKAVKRHNWGFVPKFMTIQMPDVHIDRKALERKLQSKWAIIFFIAVSIILSSIAIASCSNEAGLADAYLLQAKYDAYDQSAISADGAINTAAYATMNSNANSTDLKVRIGYFKICVGSNYIKNSTKLDWFCHKNVTKVVAVLEDQYDDPFNLIYLMNEVRSNIVSPVIFIMSVCISFISIITLIAANVNNTTLFFVSTGLTLFACFFALVALIWQQVAVDTSKSILNNLSQNAIIAKTGSVPAGLGWTSVLFLFFVSIGIVVLVVNENKALLGLQEFGSEMEVNQGVYGQDAYTGRPIGESAVNLGGAPKYPTDSGAPNVTMPTPY